MLDVSYYPAKTRLPGAWAPVAVIGVRQRLPATVREGLDKPYQAAYDATLGPDGPERSDDLRLRRWDLLRAMRNGVQEVRLSFDLARTHQERRDLAAAWAGFLRNRRDELAARIVGRPRYRVPAWLSLAAPAAPLIRIVLDQLGNWIWAQVAESLPD